MLRSDLCDFSDAYIVIKANIIIFASVFDAPNNTATATNTANNNAFGEKS